MAQRKSAIQRMEAKSKDCFDVFSSGRNGEMCIVQPIFIFTLGMIGFH